MASLASLGLFLCFVMGLTLSTLGAGGSILVVPILVYLLGVTPVAATSYSLLIVGAAALVGAISHSYKGNVDWKVGAFFAGPSIVGVLLARTWLLPLVPEVLPFGLHKGVAVLVVFSTLMLLAGKAMVSQKSPYVSSKRQNLSPRKQQFWVLADGLSVGLLTGVVGAGGGFLIIPALVLIQGLPMKLAVGTSLFIIALKSLIGFMGDLAIGFRPDMALTINVLLLTLAGILVGVWLSRFVEAAKLKVAFGIFTFVLALFILGEQIYEIFKA